MGNSYKIIRYVKIIIGIKKILLAIRILSITLLLLAVLFNYSDLYNYFYGCIFIIVVSFTIEYVITISSTEYISDVLIDMAGIYLSTASIGHEYTFMSTVRVLFDIIGVEYDTL